MNSCVAGQAPKVQVGWDTFQKQAMSPDFSSYRRYLPEEVYINAGNKVTTCFYQYDPKNPESRNSHHVVNNTNFIVRLLNKEVREVFARDGKKYSTCKKIFDKVMSFLPTSQEEKNRLGCCEVRRDSWRRTKNIAMTYFQTEFNLLKTYLMKRKKMSKLGALDKLICKEQSFADAIAYQSYRDFATQASAVAEKWERVMDGQINRLVEKIKNRIIEEKTNKVYN